MQLAEHAHQIKLAEIKKQSDEARASEAKALAQQEMIRDQAEKTHQLRLAEIKLEGTKILAEAKTKEAEAQAKRAEEERGKAEATVRVAQIEARREAQEERMAGAGPMIFQLPMPMSPYQFPSSPY